MLTLKQIRDDRAFALERLAVKGVDAAAALDRIEQLDDSRKALQAELDANLAQQNANAKEIGQLFKAGKQAEAAAAKEKTAALKEVSKQLEEKLKQTEGELNEIIVTLPNFPHSSVPQGKTAADNVIVRTGGETPELGAGALPHWELASKYDIIDFELGVKLTGAGFPVYKGQGAALQRALIAFFLDNNTSAGYTEVMPPLMVNEASGFGTGQLPDKEGQMYHATVDNFYLIPTAEVPVTNIYRDVIINESDFPIKLTAYTPCFRREAGSYGKDVRGLNRLHQFDKVEIVQIAHPRNLLRGSRGNGQTCRKHRAKARTALSHPAFVRRGYEFHLSAHVRLRSLLGRTAALAGGFVGFELRIVPGQPPEIALPRCEQEDPARPIRSTAVRWPYRASLPPCSKTTRRPKASASRKRSCPTRASK